MIFIGDTHGVRTVTKVMENSTIRDDNIIHVGDFGLGFQGIEGDIKDLRQLDDYLDQYGNTLYVVRGNHDNPIFWNRVYGLNLPKYQNINLVDDYIIKKIEGKNVLFIGGALSIDRTIRAAENPPTWWVNEKFNFNIHKLDSALNTVNKVDIIVTHTIPGFVKPYIKDKFPKIVTEWINHERTYFNTDLEADLITERKQVTSIFARIETHNKLPEHWFYGHFHQHYEEKHGDTKFIGLGINEIYELK